MRLLSSDFMSHLHGRSTTLCTLWKVIRKDGLILGFTDHDVDITFQNIHFQSQQSLTTSVIETSIGCAASSASYSGSLSSSLLLDDDLSQGAYDQATLETWMVNWSDVSQNALIDVGVFSTITKTDFAFSVEVKSIASLFDQECGRFYQMQCPLILGEGKCGVDITTSPYLRQARVIHVQNASSLQLSIDDVAPAWFSYGLITFTSGLLANLNFLIRDHQQNGQIAELTMWEAMAQLPAIGDQVNVIAGCDKSFQMCRQKFANQLQFRGFPHIPGIDILMSYANQNAVMDGGSLFK